jgi:hypothetical protein
MCRGELWMLEGQRPDGLIERQVFETQDDARRQAKYLVGLGWKTWIWDLYA